MDGVFMFKLLRLFVTGVLIAGAFWMGGIIQDRTALNEDVIRLHVVAASDSEEDQAVKLQIRDAVVAELNDAMEELPTAEDAKVFLLEHLEDIEEAANRVLQEGGFEDRASVTLDREEFDTRVYDTFTLPAGVYESLRIEVGQAQGQNWWCVVFPTLCVPDTTDEFASAAVGSGFSDTLTDTVSNDGAHKVRFFVLDLVGRLQNLFHRG